MKTTVIRNILAILSVISLLLCVAPIASVSATEAIETNVQLFIRPGRENNYAALYLSAADSAPSGTNHSTYRRCRRCRTFARRNAREQAHRRW